MMKRQIGSHFRMVRRNGKRFGTEGIYRFFKIKGNRPFPQRRFDASLPDTCRTNVNLVSSIDQERPCKRSQFRVIRQSPNEGVSV